MTDTPKFLDPYLDNIDRMEPNLATIWGYTDNVGSSQTTAQISIAISLKRIADALDKQATPAQTGIAAALISERFGMGSDIGLHVIDHLARNGFKVVPS